MNFHIIICPPCGGSGIQPRSSGVCAFCDGHKFVKIAIDKLKVFDSLTYNIKI